MSEIESKTVNDLITKTLKWLDENTIADLYELTRRKKELQEVVEPIVSKLYHQKKTAGGDPPQPSKDHSPGRHSVEL